MPGPKGSKTMLVVDNDLGFLAYLCLTLGEAGYVAVPTMVSKRAIPLLRELQIAWIDVVIVNLALPGTSELIEALRSKQLKVISIEDPRVSTITRLQVDATLRKPEGAEKAPAQEWLRTVKRVLGEEA